MYIGLQEKYPLFLSDFKELEFSRQVFEKYSNTKFWENPSTGRQVVPRGRTDGQTDRHDEPNSRFLQFSRKRLKIESHSVHC